MAAVGVGGRAPRREGGRKALSGGKETQPPKHWFVESEVNRAGQLRAPGCSPDPPSLLSLSSFSTGKSAPCTKCVSARVGRRAFGGGVSSGELPRCAFCL